MTHLDEPQDEILCIDELCSSEESEHSDMNIDDDAPLKHIVPAAAFMKNRVKMQAFTQQR